MADQPKQLEGPDLALEGAPPADVPDGGMLAGHVEGAAAMLVRKGREVFALGARCTHYGGPLSKGLFDGETVRCPWHHARFCVRTGRASHAPALNPLPHYEVIEKDGRLFVGKKLEGSASPAPVEAPPESVVVVGGGAAGGAAAEALRQEGYDGPVTVVSADDAAPYDRPNISKDYLAGAAPEEWIPLRSDGFYSEHGIELKLQTRALEIDRARRSLRLSDGSVVEYGALLLATGASPRELDVPGAGAPHVHYLRTLADSRAIIAAAAAARSAAVVGASFIGMEVAASLRQRDLEVTVIAPEARPMELALGPQLGEFVRKLHEGHGVQFRLGRTVTEITSNEVIISAGGPVEADLVVIGVGARAETGLAEAAGLEVDRGVVVNEYLRTSDPAIWAAGDIVRWPDPWSGDRIRVEHWVVAQRQGQTAARNILGRAERFAVAPFFWSQHYDVPINVVGHAAGWDAVEVAGSVAESDCAVAFRKSGKTLAVASIYRDTASLEAEVAMERGDEDALRRIVPGVG